MAVELPASELQRIAEEYEISPDKLEAIIEELGKYE